MAERPIFARVAIMGVPGAGKTTLFCALTGMDYARAVAGTGKTIGGNVRVEHPRLKKVHQVEGEKTKLSCPTLEIFDTPPLILDGAGESRNRNVLHQLRDTTGIIVVLKAYDLEGTKEEREKALAEQLEAIRSELLLTDADTLHRRGKKLSEKLTKSIPAKEKEEVRKERDLVRLLSDSISAGQTTAVKNLTAEQEKSIRMFSLFSRKPLLTIVNISENDLGKTEGASFKLELELLGMEEEERTEYMKDYGLEKLALVEFPFRLTEQLEFVTFLTIGPKEIAGWAIPKGSLAPGAAGAIHSDFEKGFINAEVIHYEDWEKAGSLHDAEMKHQRVEGKAYEVQDWDIINIKFNV